MKPILSDESLCACGELKLKGWKQCFNCDMALLSKKRKEVEARKNLRNKKREAIIRHYKKTGSYSETARFFGVTRMCIWLKLGNSKRNPISPTLRKQVLTRDNNVCVVCNRKTRLHVHHKDEDTFNNNLDNLQTLCRPCHLELHLKSQ